MDTGRRIIFGFFDRTLVFPEAQASMIGHVPFKQYIDSNELYTRGVLGNLHPRVLRISPRA